MAGKGSGFKTAMSLIKSLERAAAQAERKAERQRRKRLREEEKLRREEEHLAKQHEKELVTLARIEAVAKKKEFKQIIDESKTAFERRCSQRKFVREAIVDSVLK